VLATLVRPRFDVFVPPSIAAWSRLVDVLPQRGRDVLYRAMMPDQVAETERGARAAYEQRAVEGKAADR
jgi:hypothetical protein